MAFLVTNLSILGKTVSPALLASVADNLASRAYFHFPISNQINSRKKDLAGKNNFAARKKALRKNPSHRQGDRVILL